MRNASVSNGLRKSRVLATGSSMASGGTSVSVGCSAAETWKAWSRLGTHTSAEEALLPAVDRLRQAAETLAEELESYRD